MVTGEPPQQAPLISAAPADPRLQLPRSPSQSKSAPPQSHPEAARAAYTAAPQVHDPDPMDIASEEDLEEGQECMMRMHSALDAATCRVSLGGSAAVDVVCGGGRFAFRRDTACVDAGAADAGPANAAGTASGGGGHDHQHHSGGGNINGNSHSNGNGVAPPTDSLPAVLCWVVPSTAARGAGDACGHTHAVCALVDTGAGSRGTVTSVDVMAAGAGATFVSGCLKASVGLSCAFPGLAEFVVHGVQGLEEGAHACAHIPLPPCCVEGLCGQLRRRAPAYCTAVYALFWHAMSWHGGSCMWHAMGRARRWRCDRHFPNDLSDFGHGLMQRGHAWKRGLCR